LDFRGSYDYRGGRAISNPSVSIECISQIPDEEAVVYYKTLVEERRARLQALSLNDQEKLAKEKIVAIKDGLVSGEWTVDEIVRILENRLEGWQDLIKPIKLEMCVKKGLVKL
jgi:hypothetical protein